MHSINTITKLVKQAAREAGFDLCGIAPVGDFAELKFFPEWIAAGHAGEMKYLEARNDTGDLKRASLKHAAPWARSVIVCAINYNTAHPYSTQVNDSNRGWISRYAWSREDYHDAVMGRLREVEAKLHEAVARTSGAKAPSPSSAVGAAEPATSAPEDAGLQPPTADSRVAQRFSAAAASSPPPAALAAEVHAPVITHCYVDTGPLVERVYAKYAGVGWIGKNTCIINQQLGSWMFLGVILTSLEVAPCDGSLLESAAALSGSTNEDASQAARGDCSPPTASAARLALDLPAPDRCGTCTRCIDACPTDALIGPYQLDSNLCISYLTIEKRGEIPEPMRAGMGRHVFGCDICQDVCPWNRKSPATTAPEFQPRDGLFSPALAWLARISPEEFREKFRGSPIRRAKRTGVRRNAIIAMGNSGDHEFAPLLARLSEDEDLVIAESARWARKQLQKKPVRRE